MARTASEVFNLAKRGELWAGHLIPNHTKEGGAGTANTATASGARLENRTPIDNSLIGYIAAGTAADIDAAVKAARASFEAGTWSQLAPAERKRVILKWVDLLHAHHEELAALDCIDAGKPISECMNTDMPATIDTFAWYAEAIDKCFGKISPTGPDALGLIVREPIGVVGAVLPWNFPAQMYAWKVAPALAAGNSVVVKPAELTSLSAYRMTELAHEAGIPPEVLTLVTGDGESAGEPLGRHADVDMVSFTGSTEVGRLFLKYAAESNLKEIVLECGGKSPQIVFDDATLDDHLVDNILAAAFWNMGENCSCGSRLIVHQSIKDTLITKLIAALANWKVGLPTDAEVKIGPMVEAAHFMKVQSFLHSAREQGAKLVHGGRTFPELGSGWYIEPTIFDNVKPDSRLFQEEVFGPILAITGFETEEQALKLANDSNYGLAASLYTQNVNRARRVASRIRAGTVSINGFSEGDISTPFGGYRQSGFGGRDNGLEALDQYQQIKTIWYVGG
ncbi:MAG: aldehyde dehydrogenase [Burkholderiaceae bacterium]|nr:aldehyde dehydrogenase [Burkholderiaceae bacterium]